MTYLGTMVQAEKLKDEWIIIPYRQVGKIEDSELEGIYYNRFRHYDPNTGGLYKSRFDRAGWKQSDFVWVCKRCQFMGGCLGITISNT